MTSLWGFGAQILETQHSFSGLNTRWSESMDGSYRGDSYLVRAKVKKHSLQTLGGTGQIAGDVSW